MVDIIKIYIDELDRAYSTGKATEHSHRPALKSLLESMIDGVQAINEPKHIDCGAPDYIARMMAGKARLRLPAKEGKTE